MRRLALTAVVFTGVVMSVPTTAHATAHPAGAVPSQATRMICNREGQRDIAAGLGLKPTAVTTPSWSDQVYSCTYTYPAGVVVLSVKELGTKTATKTYMAGAAQLLGRRSEKLPLGQDSFWTAKGSVIVRKDTKVLLVDVSRLTTELGVPPEEPSDAAANIAAAVLGCWTGS